MQRDLIDKGGFGPPLPRRQRNRRRKALSLCATLALAFGIAVAVTIVSIEIAQAEILVAMRAGDGSLAVAFLACCIVVGGIVGAVYRHRQQRPD